MKVSIKAIIPVFIIMALLAGTGIAGANLASKISDINQMNQQIELNAKALTAQNIHSISNVRFVTEGPAVTGIMVDCEVNYGTRGLNEQIDVWPLLTFDEKVSAQLLYESIGKSLDQEFLGIEKK